MIVRLVDLLGLCFIADRAGKGLFALCSAGGFFGHNAFVPLVSGRSDRLRLTAEFFIADFATNYFVIAAILSAGSLLDVLFFCLSGSVSRCRDRLESGDRCTTNIALKSGCCSGLRTSRRYLFNLNRRVSRCIDSFGLRFLADLAGVCHHTGFFALGVGGHNTIVPLVSLGGNLFNSGEYCAAFAALGSGFLSGFRASRRYLGNLNRGVSRCIDSFGLRFLADLAGVCHHTGFFALGFGGYFTFVPLVACRGNIFVPLFLAVRAGKGLYTGTFTSGFGGYFTFVPLVTGRRNNFESRKLLTADIALCSGCCSGLRAGRRHLGNVNRSVSSCLDLLSHAADFIIAYGTIYDFLVSSINHAGRLDHIFALGFTGGMTQCRKCFRHTADFIATDLAVDNFVIAAGDLTGGRNNVLFHCFAGSMSLGIDLKIVQLFNQFCAALICVQIFAGCALPVLFHTGRGAGRFGFIVIFKRMVRIYRIPIFDHHIACLAICISGIAILSAAFRPGVADFSHDLMMMPCTIFLIVVYGRSGFYLGCFKICIARIAELRGGNRDIIVFRITASILRGLICYSSCSTIIGLYPASGA